MPQHPFPDPGPDREEPDRSPLPPAAEGDGPAGQGLYLCLPPEQLTLAGFAQNGEADTMTPGPAARNGGAHGHRGRRPGPGQLLR